jgi:hypothetical protein
MSALDNPRRILILAGALFGAFLLGILITLAVGNTHKVEYVTSPQAPQSPKPAPTVTQAVPRAAKPATSTRAAPRAAAQQPDVVNLATKDFTTACRQQYGDPAAIARITRNSHEPPSYWVKCFHGGHMMGGISLDQYCSTIAPGTRSINRRRYDYAVADKAWLSWQCLPG